MDAQAYARSIETGVVRYFRIFAQSGIIQNHRGKLEWIHPLPGHVGPSIVYGVHLKPDEPLDDILRGIRDGRIPSFWYVLPGATPGNIVETLKANGFTGEVAETPDEKEYGMALDLQTAREWPPANPAVEIRRVQTFEDFQRWIDIANAALHGWNMIDAEHYFTWVSQPDLAFYLGFINGEAVSTAATITGGETASLEFVSTLAERRKQGVGTAICVEALRQLKQSGAKTVILGSSPQATAIYKKLGFVPYFEKTLLKYKG